MPELESQTDADLLKAYAETSDQDAFTELVCRHGPLVWSVCRRVLGSSADAEDASQAAFLALAQQASRGRTFPSAGAWLHRVAHDIAVDVLRSRKVRQRREKEVAEMMQGAEQPATLSDEQGALLHEELNALPEKYRQAVILFHLEGKSLEQAASVMACPRATLGTWVARAREQLRSRLARRGLVLSLAALTSLLSAEAGAAELPATFATSTTAAAAQFVAGNSGGTAGAGALSPSTASLAEGALRKMSHAKLQMVTVMVVLLLCVGAGTGWLLTRATGAEGQDLAAGETNPLTGKKGDPQKPVVDDKALKAVVDGHTAFAVDLYGQLARENEGKNLFFSPYSMSVALTMTTEGARSGSLGQLPVPSPHRSGRAR